MEIELFGRRYSLSIASDKGPRSENQDRAGWIHFGKEVSEGSIDIKPTDNPETFIAVLCDGMGGLENGSKISARVCNDFLSSMANSRFDTLDDFIDIACSKLNDIEKTVREDFPNSGTTFAAAAAVDDQWCIMHLGDSRIYHGQNGWTRTLDHSPVESMLSKGLIDEDEAIEHPLRNIVSKYLGGEYAGDLEIDRIGPGEKIVLCSDGAFEYMSGDAFTTLITDTDDASVVVQTALGRGSRDNTTVIYLHTLT